MAVCLLAGALLGGGAASASPASPANAGYEDLVSFFKDWRAFQKPKLVSGVPDYGAAAMAAQQRELEAYKKRLAAIDPSAWPIPQQVDYSIVRAELAGLDFDHRVLKPWANNPAFYVTVFPEESDQPAREGPFAVGAVELWSYEFPLSAESGATDRRRNQGDPGPPRAGEDQPDRQRPGPLDLRREEHPPAERRPREARGAPRRRSGESQSRRRASQEGHGRPGGVARLEGGRRRPAPRAWVSRITTGT